VYACGTLTFTPSGATSQDIQITTLGDNRNELPETFAIDLSDLSYELCQSTSVTSLSKLTSNVMLPNDSFTIPAPKK
jgi:hypothetical protein